MLSYRIMKYAIVGSRGFKDYNRLKLELDKFDDITCIISGSAIGADSLAERYAAEHNIPTRIFPADWSLGRGAGMIRNSDIVNNCDVLVAFWDYESRGTADSIRKACKALKPTHIVDLRKESQLTASEPVLD